MAGVSPRSSLRGGRDGWGRVDWRRKFDGGGSKSDLPLGKTVQFAWRALLPERNGVHEATRTRSNTFAWRIRIERFGGKVRFLCSLETLRRKDPFSTVVFELVNKDPPGFVRCP